MTTVPELIATLTTCPNGPFLRASKVDFTPSARSDPDPNNPPGSSADLATPQHVHNFVATVEVMPADHTKEQDKPKKLTFYGRNLSQAYGGTPPAPGPEHCWWDRTAYRFLYSTRASFQQRLASVLNAARFFPAFKSTGTARPPGYSGPTLYLHGYDHVRPLDGDEGGRLLVDLICSTSLDPEAVEPVRKPVLIEEKWAFDHGAITGTLSTGDSMTQTNTGATGVYARAESASKSELLLVRGAPNGTDTWTKDGGGGSFTPTDMTEGFDFQEASQL